MKYYTIVVSGYEPIQARWTLKEARKELTSILSEGFKECRARYKRAVLHRETPNTGSITLARDRRSTLWFAATIIPV